MIFCVIHALVMLFDFRKVKVLQCAWIKLTYTENYKDQINPDEDSRLECRNASTTGRAHKQNKVEVKPLLILFFNLTFRISLINGFFKKFFQIRKKISGKILTVTVYLQQNIDRYIILKL